MENKTTEDINEEATYTCKDCKRSWWGWAIKDNRGCCPNCKRLII